MAYVAMEAAKARITTTKSTMLYHDFLLKNNFGVRAITLQNSISKSVDHGAEGFSEYRLCVKHAPKDFKICQ